MVFNVSGTLLELRFMDIHVNRVPIHQCRDASSLGQNAHGIFNIYITIPLIKRITT